MPSRIRAWRPALKQTAEACRRAKYKSTGGWRLPHPKASGVSSVKYTNKGIVEQKSKQWKKAVVTIADGETIDLFNNY